MIGALAAATGTGSVVLAQPAAAAQSAAEPRYPIMSVEVVWVGVPRSLVPTADLLAGASLTLSETERGYTALPAGGDRRRIALAELDTLDDFLFDRSAVEAMAGALEQALAQRGLRDLVVRPAAGQIGADGRDLRARSDYRLVFAVAPAALAEPVQTVGPAIPTPAPAPAEPVRTIPVGPDMPAPTPAPRPQASIVPARPAEPQIDPRLVRPPVPVPAVDQLPRVHPGEAAWYPVLGVEVVYDNVPHLMDPQQLLAAARVSLVETPQGMTGTGEPGAVHEVALAELGTLPDILFDRKALEAIAQALEQALAANGYQELRVRLAPRQIGPSGRDLRPEGDRRLVFAVERQAALPELQGPRYLVEELVVNYDRRYRNLPAIERVLGQATVELAPTRSGYVAWQEGMPRRSVRLADLDQLAEPVLHVSAVQAIAGAIVAEFNRLGYVGLIVAPSAEQFSPQGEDLRQPGDNTLVLEVRPGVVSQVRTRAVGDRIPEGQAENHPLHRRILEHSPIRPVPQSGDGQGPTSLFDGERPTLILEGDALAAYPDLPAADALAPAAFFAADEPVQLAQLDGQDEVTAQTTLVDDDDEQETDAVLEAEVDADADDAVMGAELDDDTAAGPVNGAAIGQASLLQKDLLDEYVYRLNRHPGRRVDVAISAGDLPDTYALEYIIQETKPWLIYFQASNTGTENTSEWRERFGYVNYQLTDHDDILSLDYVTAGFDASHAVLGSYEAPFPGLDRLRWKVDGSWSEYTASDVGQFGTDFSGESWSVGGELILNVFQQRDFFVDAFAGITYQDVMVDNEFLGTSAEETFLRPQAGLRALRERSTDSLHAAFWFDFNLDEAAGTDSAEASLLGRAMVDNSWLLLNWDVSQSFYLEPLLAALSRRDGQGLGYQTLAHEVALAARGQHELSDSRVIPQAQMTIGGLYTVRGYEESAAVGDDAVVFSAEYRYHLPRALSIRERGELFGRPFAWAPTQPFAQPDWDLVLKAFVDYGRVSNNSPLAGEEEEDLLGAGVGVELYYKRHFNVRVDWGFALEELEGRTSEGSSQVHVVGTVLY